MLHDNAESKGVHPNCFPSAEEVGLDAEMARKIMDYFAGALERAPDAAVRGRVEKAWISAHRAMLATEAWENEQEREELVDRYIALCQSHGMSHAAEHRLAEDFFAELRSA